MEESTRTTAAVVLAAGHGTRMRSRRIKVLHELLGRPMIGYPVEAALASGAVRVVLVVGHQAEAVETTTRSLFPDAPIATALQAVPRGTGDALRCAADATEGCDDVLVLTGDAPLMDEPTLAALQAAHSASGAALTVVTFKLEDATGYGRMVRRPDGHLAKIVEHKDANETELAIDEVNAGFYLGDRDLVFGALTRLTDDNAQGELYLTDVVELLAGDGHVVEGFVVEDADRVAGINTRAQLAALETRMLSDRIAALMAEGVTFQRPDTVRVEHGVRIARDTVIGPGVQLLGDTRIGEGCRIDAGCVLRDCVLGVDVHIKPYVVAEAATIGDLATAGPMAHLRPGTQLGRSSKVGNFVETKKIVLGEGSKASHLTYLGDATIGAGVNIGAGTITCNYDGTDKHRTVIEDGVFIGSDTQLVAPVTVGRRATVAAGTTVSVDVPPGALVLTRPPQRIIEDYDRRHRAPREEAKRKQKLAARNVADNSPAGHTPK